MGGSNHLHRQQEDAPIHAHHSSDVTETGLGSQGVGQSVPHGAETFTSIVLRPTSVGTVEPPNGFAHDNGSSSLRLDQWGSVDRVVWTSPPLGVNTFTTSRA